MQPPPGQDVATFKAEQTKQFNEVVKLANKYGLSMDDAYTRLQSAYGLQSYRIQAQTQINAMVDAYNNSTTAVQRGGEAIRGWFFGDGVNHLEGAQQEFTEIEKLEKQYNDALLKTRGPLTLEQQAQLDKMRQDIVSRINLATTNAGLNVQHSLEQAGRYKPVEAALFQTVYAGSALIPGGVAIGAAVKLGLDDAPNGRIRNDGNPWETAQDVGLSLALGGGNVLINKFDPTHGGTSTVLRAGANPLLEKAAFIGLDGGVNAAYAGLSSAAGQLLDPTRRGQGIDWGQVATDTISGFASSAIGRGANLALPPGATTTWGGVARNTLTDVVGGFTAGSLIDGGVQLGTTGRIDPGQVFNAGVTAGVTSGLTSGVIGIGNHAAGANQQAALQQSIAAQAQTMSGRFQDQSAVLENQLQSVGFDVQGNPNVPISGLVPPQPIRDPAAAAEVQTQQVGLLNAYLKNAEIFKAQQESLGHLAPSNVELQYRNQAAEVERIRNNLTATGLDLNTPSGQAQLRETLTAALGPAEAQRRMETLAQLPKGADALPPWAPERIAARTGGDPITGNLLARYEMNQFHDQYYQRLGSELANGQLNTGSQAADVRAEATNLQQQLGSQGFQVAAHPAEPFTGLQPPQRIADPQQAAEVRAQQVELLDIYLGNAQHLGQQESALGPLAPTHLAVQQMSTAAEVERIKNNLQAVGIDVSTPAGRSSLEQALSARIGPEAARQKMQVLDSLPQGADAFGAWEPERIGPRVDGYDETAANLLTRYELYRFHEQQLANLLPGAR